MVHLGLARRSANIVMNRVPLVHVLGAGPWQIPTIRRAKAMGCRVLATDGLSHRPGFELADEYEIADIRSPDETLAAARRHGVDAIVCDTTDTGVETAATVAEALGLVGIGKAAAVNCTDKSRMTDCAKRAGLHVPCQRFLSDEASIDDAVAALQPPWIVKPVDCQSGQGVSVVRDRAQLSVAYRYALGCSQKKRVLIQQFIRGVEIIVDSIVIHGRAHCLGIAVKTPYLDNPTVSERITYGCLDLPMSEQAIKECNDKLIKSLAVESGLVHAEYIISEGVMTPIDVAARGGGVCIYQRVLPHVSGVDTVGTLIELALNRRPEVQVLPEFRGGNIEFIRVPPGRIESIFGVEEAQSAPSVDCVHLFHDVGDWVGSLRQKEDRLGFVVCLANRARDAIVASMSAAALIRAKTTTVQRRESSEIL